MSDYIKSLSKGSIAKLSCPVCKAKLRVDNNFFVCISDLCKQSFPLIRGIPVLINDSQSLFSINHFIDIQGNISSKTRSKSKIRSYIGKSLPSLGHNLKAKDNYEIFAKRLLKKKNNPRVLVIGGRVAGIGIKNILDSSIDFVESDISFGPRTSLICDAHDIPFEDNSFDGVISQAVLEHVADPFRCVEEINRTLKENGLVYIEVPFMQQVHGGKYDFTRFTHIGLRMLLRSFREIDSGVSGGPGMALAWSIYYFLLSFVKTPTLKRIVTFFSSLAFFWLKFFDYYLVNRPGALDSASGFYFLGEKRSNEVPTRQDLFNSLSI